MFRNNACYRNNVPYPCVDVTLLYYIPRYMLGRVLPCLVFICTMHACVDLRLHKYSKATPFRIRYGKTVLLNKNKVNKTVLRIRSIC